MTRKVIVSDHAILRYLERVGGFDIARLRREIAQRVQAAADVGAGAVVIDGHSFLIDKGEFGPVVVTVLPVGKLPRNLMGGER
ncbi:MULTISPECIES: hypothetical protein [unclassified Paracoccus (in: a-proteobacteria)]|uniref:hypothetical protein n=1 Tax=unclassified Paracoccus (in: a-proteobacteria) TaxID=2688777 RepID=UPI0018A6B406|nr:MULTISPECIES: hypothetical protein [unclassified Paracoccus (in: a-proteobacteria)]UXU74342.1 hypothetical protein GB879_010580 [Paracoccus sp. SMMA_5]UXU80232.1 hypothetical protein GB880_010555 [Paracoccus sp. SMMA_5_TC]